MRRLAIVALVACKGGGHHGGAGSGPPPVHPDQIEGSGITAEPGAHDEEGELAFTITKLYRNEQPTSTPPFHAPGGTSTYFDAHLVVDPAATFTIGMPVFQARADDFGGFGKMWLLPTTPDAGAHFVKAFAAKFHVDVPPAAPGKLGPMEVPIAVLGHNVQSSVVGYSGTGTWDAMKGFFSSDDVDSAELFCNVSLADKRGVWSEKDADYNADVARVFAVALRDGVPLPRTPANDPTLMPTPPTLQIGARIGSHRAMVIGKSTKRLIVADTLDDYAVLLSLDPKTGTPTELYRTPARLYEGICDDTAEHCIVTETVGGSDRYTFSSDEAAKLVVLDGTKVSPLVVPGVGTSPRPTAISREGRFTVISGERAATVIYDRTTKHATRPERTNTFREVVGWRGPAAALVAITDFDHPDSLTYGVWHLDTNKLDPLATPPPEYAAPTSPDGSRTAEVRKDGTVIVTPKGGTARSFVLAERDRRFADRGCCAWLDNRYLAFPAKHFGVIDTDAMKIGFVDDGQKRVEAVPGVAAAVVSDDDNAYLATIVLP